MHTGGIPEFKKKEKIAERRIKEQQQKSQSLCIKGKGIKTLKTPLRRFRCEEVVVFQLCYVK